MNDLFEHAGLPSPEPENRNLLNGAEKISPNRRSDAHHENPSDVFDPEKVPDEINEEALRIAVLTYFGYSCLQFLRQNDRALDFPNWRKHVRQVAPDVEPHANEDELLWAWEALRQAQSVNKRFGKLSKAGVRWKSKRERFDCLPEGSEFLVALKQGELEQLKQSVFTEACKPKVRIHTRSRLWMRPGKGDRLECADVECDVTIRVPDSVYTSQREADLMRVAPESVNIVDSLTVTVSAKSLNQAYTIASRRLEPKRRSHGGRTYDHLLYLDHNARKAILLDEIRARLECGTWEVPTVKEIQADSSELRRE